MIQRRHNTTPSGTDRRHWFRRTTSTLLRLASAATLLGALVAVPSSAAPLDAAALTVTPITWNIVGLDSNRPLTDGPDTFPVGARICNVGTAVANGVTSSFVFGSPGGVIDLQGPSDRALGDLASGACADAYYSVVVTRSSASFGKSRPYSITAAATGVDPVATPAGRELYVERLLSQARNGVTGISGSAIQVQPTAAAPGRAAVVVGQTYDFTVEAATAPGGYEQLESFLDFPTTMFQLLRVETTYASPAGATNDKVYADACGWDNTPSTARTSTYRSCIGPPQFEGGKAGGDPILTTYTVKVIAAGTGTLGTLIYDFSGSSFHYNDDFGTGITALDFTAVETAPADLALVKTHDGNFTRGTNGTYDLSVANVGGTSTTGVTTVVDELPAGLSYVDAVGTGWSCSHAAGTVTCTTSDPVAAGATAPPITLTVLPTGGGTITNTARVTNAADTNTANNISSDPTLVDRLPVADADAGSTDEDTPVTVSVLDGDDLGDEPTTISTFTQGSRGSVTCTTTCTYTPAADTNGIDSFTYTITDDDGDISTATVTVAVAPVNDPPDARDDRAASDGGPAAIRVLDNDVDPDGDTLTITTPAPAAASGTVTCTATACTYTPDAGHSGLDTFSYGVTDGHGGTDTAIVTVTTSRPTPAPGTSPDTTLPTLPTPTTPSTLAPRTPTPPPATEPAKAGVLPDAAATASNGAGSAASSAAAAPAPASHPASLGDRFQEPAGPTLPRTGAGSATLAIAGSALVATGIGLLGAGRRRRTRTS